MSQPTPTPRIDTRHASYMDALIDDPADDACRLPPLPPRPLLLVPFPLPTTSTISSSGRISSCGGRGRSDGDKEAGAAVVPPLGHALGVEREAGDEPGDLLVFVWVRGWEVRV